MSDERDSFLDGDVSAEEYAAFWGCDPQYDRPPRLRGDGYLFYNYAVEGSDPRFLEQFLPAIDRTIADCKTQQPDEVDELEALKEHVQRQLKGLETSTSRRNGKAPTS
jgi:hypothetical protein